MRPMCAGREAVCGIVLVLGLGACSGGGADLESSDGCGGSAPLLAFDHDTTDPDRGIGGGVPEVSVMSLDREIEMVTGSWVASQAAFSPDGDHLVVVKADGDYESAGPESTALWVLGGDGSEPRPLTGGDVLDEDPDWSADGSIVFVRAFYEAADDASVWSVAVVPAEGGEPTEPLSVHDGGLDEPAWSPDGRQIAFVRRVFPAGGDVETTVWTMAADGSGARPLVALPYVASLDWHPDGSSLLVDTDGRDRETYLVDVRSGRARPLGTGAHLARWSPDGQSVYYFRQAGPRTWSIVEGRVEGTALVDDRTVLGVDDLGGTVLADVGLFPGFSLDVGPCG